MHQCLPVKELDKSITSEPCGLPAAMLSIILAATTSDDHGGRAPSRRLFLRLTTIICRGYDRHIRHVNMSSALGNLTRLKRIDPSFVAMAAVPW